MADFERSGFRYWRVGRMVLKLHPRMGVTLGHEDDGGLGMSLASGPGTLEALADTLREVAREWREMRSK